MLSHSSYFGPLTSCHVNFPMKIYKRIGQGVLDWQLLNECCGALLAGRSQASKFCNFYIFSFFFFPSSVVKSYIFFEIVFPLCSCSSSGFLTKVLWQCLFSLGVLLNERLYYIICKYKFPILSGCIPFLASYIILIK